MNNPLKINVPLKAWVTSNYELQQLIDCLAEPAKHEKRVAQLLFFSTSDMRDQGWVPVAEAMATVTLESRDAVVRSAVEVLNEKLASERATSAQRQNAILDAISKLQALPAPAEASPSEIARQSVERWGVEWSAPRANALPSQFREGERVMYVPHHADGNLMHEDCEDGVVTSINERFVFVRYGNDAHGQATAATQLAEVLIPF